MSTSTADRKPTIRIDSEAPTAWKLVNALLALLLVVFAYIYNGHSTSEQIVHAAHEKTMADTAADLRDVQVRMAVLSTDSRSHGERMARMEQKLDEVRDLLMKAQQEREARSAREGRR